MISTTNLYHCSRACLKVSFRKPSSGGQNHCIGGAGMSCLEYIIHFGYLMGKSDLEIAQVDGYMNVVFLLFIGQA